MESLVREKKNTSDMESLVREIKKLTNEMEAERERRRNEKPIDYTIAISKYKQVIKENQKLKDQLKDVTAERDALINKIYNKNRSRTARANRDQ